MTRERRILLLLSLAFWGLLSYYLYFLHLKNQVGDTTFAAQILYNFKYSFVSNTTFGASAIESIDNIWYRPAQEVCAMDLVPRVSQHAWWHLYFVKYLLLPFARVMDIQVLIAVVYALIYTSLLVFSYLLCRRQKIGKLNAVLFALLLMQHPLWSIGLEGQLYFNRLFLPFVALLILLLEAKRARVAAIIIVTILAASTNEIYGIVLGLIFGSYLWINRRFNRTYFLLAVFSALYSILGIHYLQANMAALSTQNSFFQNLTTHALSYVYTLLDKAVTNPKTLVFLVVNLAGMGILALGKPRQIIPLLLFFAPNIFVNIGGADKTGWATHYHVGYFVPLIWLSVSGLARFSKKPFLQSSLIILLIGTASLLDPHTLSLRKPYFAPLTLARQVRSQLALRQSSLEFRESLRRAIGPGESVSLPEAVAYNLYDRQIYYYPVNIDSVDAVVFKTDPSKPNLEKYYTINYGHQDPLLDACIKERMIKQGFDFDSPQYIEDWAIIKRK